MADEIPFQLIQLVIRHLSQELPEVANPRGITRGSASRAFIAAFPQATITALLAELSKDARFSTIDAVRNVVGHRLSGRRSVRGASTMQQDGSFTTDWQEDTWHLPGSSTKLNFGEDLLQKQLDNVTDLLAELSAAARDFAEHQPVQVQP